jgi:hypothetical protein
VKTPAAESVLDTAAGAKMGDPSHVTPLLRPFHAALAPILIFAAQSPAATIYQVYQGGTGGTLELQFTTQIPVAPPLTPGLLTSFREAPISGTVQLTPYSYFGDNAKFGYFGDTNWYITRSPASPNTLYFSSNDTFELDFTGDIPTTPGTYALTPGVVAKPVGSLFPETVGSQFDMGIPTTDLSRQISLDTLVISSSGPPAMPEPASFGLFLWGLGVYPKLVASKLWK